VATFSKGFLTKRLDVEKIDSSQEQQTNFSLAASF